MTNTTSSKPGILRFQHRLAIVAACGAIAIFGPVTTQGALLVLTGGDAADGLTLSNVVQATSQATYSQDRENNFSGGENVTWQGVSVGWHSAGGNDALGNGSETANLDSSLNASSAAQVPAWGGTLNIGNSADDLAVKKLLAVTQSGTAINLTIDGLTAGAKYRVDLLVFFANANPRAARVGYNGGPTTDYNLENTSNQFYDIYETVTADGTGRIVVNLTNGEYTGPGPVHDETGAIWNAVIVSSVPTPPPTGYTGYLGTEMKVLVNQYGYDSNSTKRVVVQHHTTLGGNGGSFVIYNSANQIVYYDSLAYKGEIQSGGTSWGRYYWVGEFKTLNVPGKYTLRAEVNGTAGYSYEFEIKSNGMKVPLDYARQWFYYQRCGSTANNSPFYDHCHMADGYVDKNANGVRDGADSSVDLTRGWHDASADYTKYMSSAYGRSIFSLAYASELLKTTDATLSAKLLEEANWGGYLLKNMIDPNGGFYAVVTSSNGTPTDWALRPENQTDGVQGNADDRRALIGGKDPTEGFALVAALAILGYENNSADYKAKAELTWAYYNGKPTVNWVLYYAYRLLASTELYKATGKLIYLTDANTCVDYLLNCIWPDDGTILDAPGSGPFTHHLDTFIPAAALFHFAVRNPAEAKTITIKTGRSINWFNGVKNWLSDNPFLYMRQNIHGWGAYWFMYHNGNNWYTGSNPSILGAAWALSEYARMNNDAKAAEIAQRQVDWVMGMNPLNVGMVEGLCDFETDNFSQYYAGYSPKNLPGYIPNGIGRPYDTNYNEDKPFYNWPTTCDAYRYIEGWIPQNANFILTTANLIKIYGY